MLDLLFAMVHWFFFGISWGWWQWRHHVNDRAVIFVNQGPFVDLELGVRRDIQKEGQIFQYQNGKHAIIIKPTDPLKYWEHERLLSVVDGEVIAVPFIAPELKTEVRYQDVPLVHIPGIGVTLTHKVKITAEEVLPDPMPAVADPIVGTGRQQDETLISNVVDGHLAAELAESPTAPGKGGWSFKELRWILLVALVLVVGFIIYKFVLHGHLPGFSVGNSTILTPTRTLGPARTPLTTPHFTTLVIQARYFLGI